MPRPRTGRPRVEDCVALRVIDLVRPDGSLGLRAFGSAELPDPTTGAPAGTVSWRTEVFDGWGWVHVAHRRVGQSWDAAVYKLDLSVARGAVGLRWRLHCALTGEPARTLFLPAIEARFGTREAHRLAYGSQGMSAARRAEVRARRLRQDFGGAAEPVRPKGMWGRTFERRLDLLASLEARSTRTCAGPT